MTRKPEEIEKALETQLGHLDRSCEAFDNGDKTEALRIATIIFTLVHDHGQTVSILTQAGLRAHLKFVSTAGDLMGEARHLKARHTPLLMLDTHRRPPEFVSLAVYNRPRGLFPPLKEMKFDDWWDELIFFDDGVALTRKDLASILRNKEGGGHYDRKNNNANYHSFSRPDIVHVSGAGMTTVDELQFSSMRQIADEIFTTFQVQGWLDGIKVHCQNRNVFPSNPEPNSSRRDAP
jgi:hypothetical protein